MKRLRLLTLLLFVAVAASSLVPASAQDETLTLWTWKAFHVPGYEAIGKAFAEKTGVNLKVEFFSPDDAYRSKVQTAAQSGDLPDILAYWSDGQWDLAASGVLQDLTNDVDEQWASSFLPGTFEKTSVWTQKKFDDCKNNKDCLQTNLQVGQVFSVPMAAGSFYIVYANKRMLEAASLPTDVAPKDTGELLDVMEKVNQATGKGVTVGGKFQDILRNWVVNALAIGNCGPDKYSSIIGGDPDASFTDPCAVDAFAFVGDITKRNLWQPGFQTLTIDDADVAFAKGEAAFDFGGTFTLGFLIQQGMKPEDILAFPIPMLPTAEYKPLDLSPFSLIELGVTKDSKNAQDAKDFIKFFTSPEQMAAFAKITGDMPAVKLSSDPAVVGDTMSGIVKAFENADKSPFADPAWPPQGDTVWAAMDAACNQQVTGEGNLADLLKAADEAARFDRSKRTQ